MRKLLFILITIGTAFCQSRPTLYVAAPSGLSLREGPGTDAKRIKLLEYGTLINNYTYSDGEWIKIDGYNGRWIKTTSDGKTGYVFDGYTLPIKVPKGGNMMDYFVSVFGKIVFEDSVKTGMDSGDDFMDKHIYHFSSGTIFIETGMYEAYESTLLNLELSYDKCYLLYYLMEETLWGKHHLVKSINYPTKEFNSDTLSIKINPTGWQGIDISYVEGAISYVKVFWIAGSLSITWGSAV